MAYVDFRLTRQSLQLLKLMLPWALGYGWAGRNVLRHPCRKNRRRRLLRMRLDIYGNASARTVPYLKPDEASNILNFQTSETFQNALCLRMICLAEHHALTCMSEIHPYNGSTPAPLGLTQVLHWPDPGLPVGSPLRFDVRGTRTCGACWASGASSRQGGEGGPRSLPNRRGPRHRRLRAGRAGCRACSRRSPKGRKPGRARARPDPMTPTHARNIQTACPLHA